MTVFIDGNPPGCVCTIDCEWPCWQRAGLTTRPCCPDCAPLHHVDDEHDGGHDDRQVTSQRHDSQAAHA